MKKLFRLSEFLRPYWKSISLNLILLIALTAVRLGVPAVISQFIDVGLTQKDYQFIVYSSALILALGLTRSLFSYAQGYLGEWIANHVSFDIRNRLYDHIQHLSFSYHDHTQTGQLISRCIEDVRSIQRFTGFGIGELFRISLLLVGIVILLFLTNQTLALIALAPIVPLVLVTTSFGGRIGELFLAADSALGELSTRLQENISGVHVVRAFARERYEINRFTIVNRELYDARITVINEWSRVMPTAHLLVHLSTILIIWFGGNMVLRGELSLGELVAFNAYLLLMSEPARQIVWLVNLAGEAKAGTERIFQILDEKPDISSPSNPVKVEKFIGRVVFKNVALRYASEQNYALKSIDLVVEPNQVIALIGATGSGKTTFVNLIPRFYNITDGAISIDGIDIRDMAIHDLRKQIGIVLQTSLLFAATVGENIAFGHPTANEDEIISVARAAQAHEFIMDMPLGYDTMIGEKGVTVSGGQRQRIAIARALLLDPRILILDDSTSSVDTETEFLIQTALQKLMEGRTTFVIAQRLSTVRRADLILVLENGRIVERGTHLDLIDSNGFYKQLMDIQIKHSDNLSISSS